MPELLDLCRCAVDGAPCLLPARHPDEHISINSVSVDVDETDDADDDADDDDGDDEEEGD